MRQGRRWLRQGVQRGPSHLHGRRIWRAQRRGAGAWGSNVHTSGQPPVGDKVVARIKVSSGNQWHAGGASILGDILAVSTENTRAYMDKQGELLFYSVPHFRREQNMDFYFQRTYRGPLQAVLLDWAGTTMDYGCFAPAVAFVAVFKKYGVPISIEEARVPMGAHKRVHIQQISQMEGVARRWEELHGNKPTEQDVDKMFADFIPMQLEVLADYADLIPGTLETVAALRKQGLKIGSTTGYTGEMMDLLQKEAADRGYAPDVSCCATQVPAGRPEPWMCIQNAMDLQVYPMEAMVKVGDTLPDIWEGLNGNMWTIGLAKTGNEMGLTEAQIDALAPDVRQRKLQLAYDRMAMAGAHYVVDSIADILPCIEQINARLARGERP